MDSNELLFLSQYNAWANKTLYDACVELSETEYKTERECYFGSIHKTLNHILVGDRIWFGRFENVPENLTLADILYEDFLSLRSAREIEDHRIISYAKSISQSTINGKLHYKNLAGDQIQDPMNVVLRHVFNHQTHHRGQVHCLLSQTTIAPPSLDIIYFVRAND